MSARRITTLVGAARHVGVTPATIRSWVTKGWLSDDRSWTPRQIEKARDQSRQILGRGSTAAHGTPSRLAGRLYLR